MPSGLVMASVSNCVKKSLLVVSNCVNRKEKHALNWENIKFFLFRFNCVFSPILSHIHTVFGLKPPPVVLFSVWWQRK